MGYQINLSNQHEYTNEDKVATLPLTQTRELLWLGLKTKRNQIDINTSREIVDVKWIDLIQWNRRNRPEPLD